ncbi:MAG TPA: Fe-S cluster assembly protein SufD [Steroidobacteraceae bacterium]|nr:Fe-S cluster assembly protein SufD [Steroidobacteraceae bacterium]
MNAALATRIAAEYAAAAPSLPAEGPSREFRQNAIRMLTERGLPTSRDENWKYVNLRPLEKVRFAPAAGSRPSVVSLKDLPPPVAGYSRYTFVDGVFARELSADSPHAGVNVRSMAWDMLPAQAASGSDRAAPADDLRFALLNDAFATDGALIQVDSGANCPSCIELVFVATVAAGIGASYPRAHVQVASGARVGLIERHVSVGGEANFVNGAVHVEIARDAAVQHYRVQQMGPRTIWFDTLTADLAQGARYQLHGVNLGAQSARSTIRVALAGERSEVSLSNVSVGGRNQVHDTFALVDHVAAHAKTEQNFRGIASDRARVAFNGKIVVRRNANGTDSRQSLRGLLAGPDAEIDVRPQLEIYNDDVRCNHGATAGKLDDHMLFYLLSRGLDRETAQRLLKWAFLEDVVARIDVPELRRQIEQSLAGQLNEAAALQELL